MRGRYYLDDALKECEDLDTDVSHSSQARSSTDLMEPECELTLTNDRQHPIIHNCPEHQQMLMRHEVMTYNWAYNEALNRAKMRSVPEDTEVNRWTEDPPQLPPEPEAELDDSETEGRRRWADEMESYDFDDSDW
jgi:hypothetical protein